jgi:hypothetical protein
LNFLLLSQLGYSAILPKLGTGGPGGRLAATAGPEKKIQAICNGNPPPFTMQGLETATKKPRAQEQWEAMKRTMRRAMETMQTAA